MTQLSDIRRVSCNQQGWTKLLAFIDLPYRQIAGSKHQRARAL
jgi:hypothetical protein